mmetsp:Transcript_19658/g.55397  ORF Transcript_19658/g.55397 Transcript_19658/m.55397 type:complete len:294 (-) Transcript_19658:733-1614(-)
MEGVALLFLYGIFCQRCVLKATGRCCSGRLEQSWVNPVLRQDFGSCPCIHGALPGRVRHLELALHDAQVIQGVCILKLLGQLLLLVMAGAGADEPAQHGLRQLGVAAGEQPLVLQGLRCPRPPASVPVGHQLDERCQARHAPRKVLEREWQRLGSLCEGAQVAGDLQGSLHSSALARHQTRKELEDRDAEAEDVARRVPEARLVGLGRNVARGAADALPGTHAASSESEVNEHGAWLSVGLLSNHDIWLLDVTMYDAVFVQVVQSRQALFEEVSPPCLTHADVCVVRILSQLG